MTDKKDMWKLVFDKEQGESIVQENRVVARVLERDLCHYLIEAANGGYTEFQALNVRCGSMHEQIEKLVRENYELKKKLETIGDAVKEHL